jgi:hypothetical protein
VTEPSPAAPQGGPQAPIAPQATPAASPAPTPSSASPAPRAGVISDGAYDGLPADQRDRYARVKNGDSGAQWVHRDQLAPDVAKPDANALPSDPAAKVKIGAYEISESELGEMMTRQAAEDLRKATLPATPGDYAPDLPEKFTMPAGVEFKLDPADSMLADARTWAHSRGLSQSDFSELVAIYASAKGKEQAFLNTAAAAEVAKLGANGSQRVSAIDTYLRGLLGDDLAAPMRSVMVTEKIVRGWETIIHKFQSQGVASFSQAHREPGQAGGKVSDEEYGRMSPAARLDYARSFDQRQFGGTKRDEYSSDQR